MNVLNLIGRKQMLFDADLRDNEWELNALLKKRILMQFQNSSVRELYNPFQKTL